MKKYFDFWQYINGIENEHYKKMYESLFCKLGVRHDLVWRNVIVVLTVEEFEKQGRKNYPTKPTNVYYNVLTMDRYLNCLTGILFFHDRVKKCYHKYGYIPLYSTCHNPDCTKKIRRNYEYIDLDDIYKAGGYREQNILENFSRVDFDYSNGYKVITFYDTNNNSFDYSVKNNTICG